MSEPELTLSVSEVAALSGVSEKIVKAALRPTNNGFG